MSHPFRREEVLREISDINVVPLADVSLVLLILLLVLSPMMTQSMLRVQTAAESSAPPLPERDPTPPPPPELVLAVALNPGGISVGEHSFQGLFQFLPYMTALFASRTDKKVFLSPHPDIPNGQVVHMIETLKSCGAASVALVQTQEETEETAPAQSQEPRRGG